MLKAYYAHSVEDRSEQNWQTLQSHVTNVGELAGQGLPLFLARRKSLIIPDSCMIWANTQPVSRFLYEAMRNIVKIRM